MKRISVLALVNIVLLTGCIEYSSTVKLNQDGSGTVEETVLLSNVIKEMMASFAEGFSDSADVEAGFEIFDEEELIQQAEQMGEGVKYVKGEKIQIEGKEGYKAFYKFNDITKLKLSDSPSDKIPGNDITMQEPAEEENYITFNFTKGEPATLEMIFPQESYDSLDTNIDSADEDMMANEIPDEHAKMLLKDFKVSMALQLNGDIVETNATHVENNLITIFNIDFGKLLEIPEKYKELQKIQPTSLQEAKEILKDISGFKMELNEKVTVKFN